MGKSMTYEKIQTASSILGAMPLDVTVKEKGEGEYTRSLSRKLTGRVLAIMANLKLHLKNFEELKQGVIEAVKSDHPDFDERLRERAKKRQEVEGENYLVDFQNYIRKKQTDITFKDEEFEARRDAVEKKWEEVKDEEFENLIVECEEKVNEGIKELMKSEVEVIPALFSSEELEELTEHTSGARMFKLDTGEVLSRLDYLLRLREVFED